MVKIDFGDGNLVPNVGHMQNFSILGHLLHKACNEGLKVIKFLFLKGPVFVFDFSAKKPIQVVVAEIVLLFDTNYIR